MLRRWFGGAKKPPRVLVLGLDCAAPELVFDQFRADLPTLSRLMQGGTWGELRSSLPCITVPAWASMFSSRDPGVLGCYGFRNRADWSYEALTTADSTAIRVPRVWDVLSAAGREAVVLNVPQTYPVRPLNGHLISCFLTPGTENQFAYPAIFKQEVLQVAPDYAFDVRDFRHVDRAALLQKLIDLTEVQYRVALHSLKTKPWDAFIHVNIGVDRMHHAFWRYHDPLHRLHEPDSPLRTAIHDYYVRVDGWLARLIEAAGEDTIVLVVSDHGAKRMDGAVCVNEWLWRSGWLTLKQPPTAGQITAFDSGQVDWSRTRAWASGGYYGRVFLNVAGREPEGQIAPEDYERVRDDLSTALTAIPLPDGSSMGNRVFKPQDIYEQVNGFAPDLLVYFGDLHWRAVGSLGYEGIYTFENDTGPDDANHAENGLFILHHPQRKGAGCVEGAQLMDIAPSMLDLMGVPIPADIQGRVIGSF